MGQSDTIDDHLFEQLYRSHWRQLRDYCYFHTQDQYLAEEIVQDIFFSVWERRTEINARDNSFFNYLMRAAKYKLFDFHRHCAAINTNMQAYRMEHSGVCHATEHTIQFNELLDNVQHLIDKLPGKSQEIYRLAQEEGLSKPDIAQRVGLSIKSVEYHLYKTSHLIRNWIEKYNS